MSERAKLLLGCVAIPIALFGGAWAIIKLFTEWLP
jgi:hypothetical protein